MKIERDNYFAIIPQWILDSGINPRAMVLYCILWTYADKEDKSCFPSVQTLANRIGVNKATTHRLLNELKGIQAIEVKNRFKDNSKQSNLYILKTSNPSIKKDTTPSVNNDTTLVSSVSHRTITNELESNMQASKLSEEDSKTRKAIFKTFTSELGYEPKTQMEKSGWFKCAKELQLAGATPEDVMFAIQSYKKHWNNVDVSPYAITKWFGKFESLGKEEKQKQAYIDNPKLRCDENGHSIIDFGNIKICNVCKEEWT